MFRNNFAKPTGVRCFYHSLKRP